MNARAEHLDISHSIPTSKQSRSGHVTCPQVLTRQEFLTSQLPIYSIDPKYENNDYSQLRKQCPPTNDQPLGITDEYSRCLKFH